MTPLQHIERPHREGPGPAPWIDSLLLWLVVAGVVAANVVMMWRIATATV